MPSSIQHGWMWVRRRGSTPLQPMRLRVRGACDVTSPRLVDITESLSLRWVHSPTSRVLLCLVAVLGLFVSDTSWAISTSRIYGTRQSADTKGVTKLDITKHEPAAYRYGRGSLPCRFDPREQVHSLGVDDVLFQTASRETHSAIWMDVGPFDDHFYHFRFFTHQADEQFEVGDYYDSRCTADPNGYYDEVEFSLSTLPFDPTYRVFPNYLAPCFEGGFRILEVEYDASGLLERLAVDFKYRGVGVLGDVDASLRYNASPRYFEASEAIDLAALRTAGRPAHMEIDKTIIESAPIEDMDLCTITGEGDVVVGRESNANPWDTEPAESPDGAQSTIGQYCPAVCVHLLAGAGSLNVYGSAACFDVQSGEQPPTKQQLQEYCESGGFGLPVWDCSVDGSCGPEPAPEPDPEPLPEPRPGGSTDIVGNDPRDSLNLPDCYTGPGSGPNCRLPDPEHPSDAPREPDAALGPIFEEPSPSGEGEGMGDFTLGLDPAVGPNQAVEEIGLGSGEDFDATGVNDFVSEPGEVATAGEAGDASRIVTAEIPQSRLPYAWRSTFSKDGEEEGESESEAVGEPLLSEGTALESPPAEHDEYSGESATGSALVVTDVENGAALRTGAAASNSDSRSASPASGQRAAASGRSGSSPEPNHLRGSSEVAWSRAPQVGATSASPSDAASRTGRVSGDARDGSVLVAERPGTLSPNTGSSPAPGAAWHGTGELGAATESFAGAAWSESFDELVQRARALYREWSAVWKLWVS